jgi:transcriptional regulator with XRE-family HTH domain
LKDALLATQTPSAYLCDLFEQRLLSQEEFAAMCGLDRTYMSGIERGKRNVALRNIEAIAVAFDISASELLKGI